MLNASAYAFGWKTVLLAMASQNRDLRLAAENATEDQATGASDATDAPADDCEATAFQLDDTEMADRLAPGRVRPTHSTPPHAHLLFPMVGRLTR